VSIQANVFHPKLNSVLTTIKDSIVVEIGDNDDNRVSVFFMQNSTSAVELLGRSPLTPVQQVAEFVSRLLQEAGFDSFEFEKVKLACCPEPVVDTFYAHPSEVVEDDDKITWIVGNRYRPQRV
jgi:hypothetical protein